VKYNSLERSIRWKFLQILARILTTILFDLKVYGRRNIPPRGGVLIISNHQGNLDPVVIAVRLHRPVNYIAKSELFRGHWSLWLLHAVNAFPVRQGTGDVGAVKETIHRLRQGHLLNMYPEGSRTEDGRIAPLLRGVALIVRRANVPVVPAVIVGSFEAWPIHRVWPRPWPVKVKFGPPMNLTGMEPDQMIATIDHQLRTMFEELQCQPVGK
jgi:1-acyl-sn-glycerol-3-phosphate acyltransferase